MTGAAPHGRLERISRRAALRLTLGGALTVALAGGRVPLARAGSREDCIRDCYERYVLAAQRDLDACNSLYRNPKSSYAKEPGWARVRDVFQRGGWAWVHDTVDQALLTGCRHRAVARMEEGLDRCEDACRETCPGTRTTSGAAGSATVCRGDKPPASPPPKPPAPPDGGNDICAPCAAVGGMCCYGPDPDRLCNCGNPSLDGGCERYGCPG